MRCTHCHKNHVSIDLPHMPGKLCKTCAINLIEKRVRKHIRTNKLFSKHDEVIILDDNSAAAAVSGHLIRRIIPYLDVHLTKRKIKDRRNIASKSIDGYRKQKVKVVLPWSLDDEIEYKLEQLFTDTSSEDKDAIKLLRNLTEQEIEWFARQHKLRFSKTKPYNKDIRKMLQRIHKNHPSIKFSLLKSLDALLVIPGFKEKC